MGRRKEAGLGDFWREYVWKSLLKTRFGNYLWVSIIHVILGHD